VECASRQHRPSGRHGDTTRGLIGAPNPQLSRATQQSCFPRQWATPPCSSSNGLLQVRRPALGQTSCSRSDVLLQVKRSAPGQTADSADSPASPDDDGGGNNASMAALRLPAISAVFTFRKSSKQGGEKDGAWAHTASQPGLKWGQGKAPQVNLPTTACQKPRASATQNVLKLAAALVQSARIVMLASVYECWVTLTRYVAGPSGVKHARRSAFSPCMEHFVCACSGTLIITCSRLGRRGVVRGGWRTFKSNTNPVDQSNNTHKPSTAQAVRSTFSVLRSLMVHQDRSHHFGGWTANWSWCIHRSTDTSRTPVQGPSCPTVPRYRAVPYLLSSLSSHHQPSCAGAALALLILWFGAVGRAAERLGPPKP